MRAAWRPLTYAVLSTTFVLLLSACGVVVKDPGFWGGSDAATVSIKLTGASSVILGGQSQYSAAVSGSADASVTWSVNGIAGGNAQAGSISSAGLYTAPVAAPQAGAVTITATSVAKPAISQSLPVTLTVPPPSSNQSGGGGTTIALTLTGPATVTLGSSAQYTASISGSSNAGVSWSVNGVAGGNAGVGLIDAGGVYTAPATAPSSNSVTITATSLAKSSVSQSLAVTLLAPVPPSGGVSSVTLALSGPASLMLGASAQYSAIVTGSANTGVTWSVNGVPGGTSQTGFITSGGLYSAPASAPSSSVVTITATSLADPSVSQGIAVALAAPPPPPPPSVTLTLTGANSITLGASAQYTAVVSGSSNTQVIWSVNGVPGGNSASGTISANGLYSAPAVMPASSSVTITATSVGDPTVSQSLSVSLVSPPPPPPDVTLSLSGARSVTVGTTAQYTASVSGSSNKQVTWSVNGVAGGNSTAGTISASGLYRAPTAVPSSSSVTIRATSVADPTVSQSLSVSLISPPPPPPNVTLSLSGVKSVTVGTSAQYTASVSGSSNTQVRWSVNGVAGGNSTVGSISTSGLYRAPATMPSSSQIAIKATSDADPSVSSSMAVTLAAAPKPPDANVTIALSGATTVMLGASSQYSAVVTGTSDKAVAWSVNGIVGGNGSVGTISATGFYTAPGNEPSGNSKVTIAATSQADASVSQSLSVTLTTPPAPPKITVTLSGATSVALGASAQYAATVTGSSNTAVTWSVEGMVGGDPSVGVISPTGRYTAPGTMPQSSRITITATSLADSTVAQSLAVTLTAPPPPPTVSVTINGATKVTLGTTAQYSATVTGTSNTGVTWSVNGINEGNGTVGSISAAGLYTAPTVAPQPSTVTIAATSAANSTAASSLVVTLMAPSTRIPASAVASSDLNASTKWAWNHDPGTPGSSQGSTTYPVAGMSGDNAARQFYMTYSAHGGEIYHLSFAKDTSSTHFVYDTYVYVVDPSQLANLELDMNAVTADGRTIILATQCSTYSKSWEYTLYSSGAFHWHPSNIPCDPMKWTANKWHHIQIASHRDNSGNATYDWVSFDGQYSDFVGASGPDSANLGWAIGTLLINFQIDGSSKLSGSNTLYTDKFIVWRW